MKFPKFETIVNGNVALDNLRVAGAARKYPDAGDARYQGDILLPKIFPKFSVSRGNRAFTIGSCFAREIEEQLDGSDLPTLKLELTKNETGGRANSILNEFNPASIAQRINWAVNEFDTTNLPDVVEGTKDDAVDLLLRKGHSLLLTQLMNIRRAVDDIYRDLPTSDLLIITFGMNEVWRDEEAGVYLNRMPAPARVRRHPQRFRFQRLSVDDAFTQMAAALERVMEKGVKKILLTVSPVPLQATFMPNDCIVANSYSKAVLRCVADRLCQTFPDNVDYFPSYEIVMSGGLNAFEKDLIHVRRDVVARITQHMVSCYVE